MGLVVFPERCHRGTISYLEEEGGSKELGHSD